MLLQEQQNGAVVVLKPDGPLVAEDADQFKQRALDLLHRSLGRYVVDASDIPYVDSRGLEALLEVNDKMFQTGHALKIASVTDTVRQVLELTNLSRAFEHFADVNAAVRSFL